MEAASPGKPSRHYDGAEEVKEFFRAVNLPDRDRYLRTARRLIDVTVWTHVIDIAGIEQLMDMQAKNELRDQMKYVPERTGRNGEIINQDEIDRMLPPVTPENIYATLERFQGDAETIFRRGIVNVFTKLDRRFRSHDGFKVGSRMIIDYLLRNSTHLYGDRADMLTDVERTFLVLDGKSAKASYAGIVEKINRENPGKWNQAVQFEVVSEYFKVRLFKNGNAHLWFTRKDLVKKVNEILADHYGEVLGDGLTKEEDPSRTSRPHRPATSGSTPRQTPLPTLFSATYDCSSAKTNRKFVSSNRRLAPETWPDAVSAHRPPSTTGPAGVIDTWTNIA